MFRSSRHKGLRALYQYGDPRGVRAQRILAALDTANGPRDMDLPGYRLHGLKGSLAGYWAVNVSDNWRVIFRFIDSDAELLDYLDYH
ncbi:type II toxin-antitoxin system RelE/ParE family toxin [Pseudomonas nitroreducens]|uniref:type II toxin-antitoxin system RelE/ParE family toxin n=1 Tax=Pseudomonas TaxID=286 RepID=UPI0007EE93CB|nr:MULTISPECIES: type II toxin-antitoxin system RelE/ParE family toxin [Pseudomonas]MDG9855475.1 type II toxin-antitoxin system RelE/ParE family toxin [Pseudomonas nitroreducens]MDH1072383.1 type II toxin-antitoxin system RelE/ParE family toxin [Pseudomonas nitroreducens]NMZ71965.1 Killer protein [Pseudomonas nitroreducens]OBY57854.1 Killer protein [Pseudomonas sp. AU12215]UCL90144.1 type II toxin-antitoxin system RelE/ParE family toxin [Pseudomonas sp. HS-18]